MIIREAAEADIAVLVALNGCVQKLHAGLEPSQFRADVDDAELGAFFGRMLREPHSRILLAQADQAAVGYIWFERQERSATPFSPARTRLYVHHIAVQDATRCQGVGSALLAAVETAADRSGIRRIVLDVWVANQVARTFFEAAGFTPFNMVMAKEL